jgi:hypothetical protein
VDIEPNIQDFATLRQGSKWHLFLTLLGRYVDVRRVRDAKYTYSALIREIRSHGYQVETYQFPFIADERAVRSSVLERLTGIVDVRGDREVLMLYTSFNQSLDSALIWVYGPDAQAITVGSTTGPTSDPHFARLNREEFSRDLKVANHFSHVIGVYNLEGCVRQGFLARLSSPEKCQLERIRHHLGGISPKSHAVPGTRPKSLVDRFESSLFPRRDSNCLRLENCVVEQTSPSPEYAP